MAKVKIVDNADKTLRTAIIMGQFIVSHLITDIKTIELKENSFTIDGHVFEISGDHLVCESKNICRTTSWYDNEECDFDQCCEIINDFVRMVRKRIGTDNLEFMFYFDSDYVYCDAPEWAVFIDDILT